MNRQRVTYTPTGGVCSKMMIVDSEDNVIKNVQIIGGCQGNTQGLSRLLVGMEIARLSGVWKALIAASVERHARTSWHRH